MNKNRLMFLIVLIVCISALAVIGIKVISIADLDETASEETNIEIEDVVEILPELRVKSIESDLTVELTEDEVKLFKKSSLIKLEYLKGSYRFLYSYDEDENVLVICYEDQTYIFDLNQGTYKLNGGNPQSNDLVETVAGDYYINIDKMKLLSNIDYFEIYEPLFLLTVDMNSEMLGTYSTKETMGQIKKLYPEKLMLTWEAVYSKTPDVSKLYEMSGLDIISPVWYDLISGDGGIKSKKSDDYIEWSKSMGYDLWPAVTNGFDLEMTHELLRSVTARTEFIDKLVAIYRTNGFSGINIDFENIYKDDKDDLSQFVAELSSAFHRKGLIVSMDVTFAGGSDTWSKCYDRRVLGQWVDYIIVMAYDEHWGSSPISGSVASLNWVEDNLVELIKEVDADKIMLGIPFYMRVWFERPSSDKVNHMKVTSDAITMFKMESLLAERDHTVLWDEPAGQYYVSYIDKKDNAVKKIWIEDERSLTLKVDLVQKYGLKGVASWRRGYELESIWQALNDALRN